MMHLRPRQLLVAILEDRGHNETLYESKHGSSGVKRLEWHVESQAEVPHLTCKLYNLKSFTPSPRDVAHLRRCFSARQKAT